MEESKDIFTGERFVPGIEDIQLEMEHFQRYMSIGKLVAGKNILDAASGEGYGSNILAQYAKSVVGLDIDEGAVNRSSERYKEQRNLRYLQGSIASIPLEDASLDVVVSFETIEHVSEDLQQSFLKEIKRVLKPDGFLIMSTPNKEVYSDKHNYHNCFHIKEFYKDEFVRFLNWEFKNVKLYNQFFEVTAVIASCNGGEHEAQYFRNHDVYNHDGKYFIAIASNQELPKESINSVFMNEKQEYEERIGRIISLQTEVDERNAHLHVLDNQIEEKDKRIVELQNAEEQRNHYIEMLNQRLEECENEALQEKDKLTDEIDEKDIRLSLMSRYLSQAESDLVDARYALKCKDEAIQCKDEEMVRRGEHIMKLDTQIADLLQTIANKEGHIEQLLEVDRMYQAETKTVTFKMRALCRKIRRNILPHGSKRRHALWLVKNGFKKVQPEVAPAPVPVECSQKDVVEAVTAEPEVDYTKMYAPLQLPMAEKPCVSIIIPVYNQFDYTYRCLQSIKKHTGNIPYEVIIANDCSTDATTAIDKIVTGVKVITPEQNLRFLRNCNHAAKYAKGEYIFFLNNDTEVHANWLQPLIDLMEQDASIGMAGSKLVYADGRLQEAGGILWKDGSAWNYGNRRDPEEAEFNYVKEVDYISGAAILIRHSLWKEIGGFDETFAPAYCEDSDLAFEVRKHGYKVVYQPLSVVTHYEGVSNGTDTNVGQKQYQVVNQKKFLEKWEDVLGEEHFSNGENVFLAKDRSRSKKQLLMVDHYVPHFDQDAGGKTTFMYLKLFVQLGFKVTFIGDNFYRHEPYTTIMNQLGIEVLYGSNYADNWKLWIKENGKYFDYIYLNRPHITVKYINLVKKYCPGKVFYYGHDLHFLREYRQYEIDGNEELLKSSQRWKRIEFDLFNKADVVHVPGSFEQEYLSKLLPNKPIRNIPAYIYEEPLQGIDKNFDKRKDIIFVGGFGHPPNLDGVLWFAKEVFPKIVAVHPDIRWYIVGSKTPQEVLDLAADEHIIVTGFVSDEELDRLYKTTRLAVAPLRVGAGVKGKVVEACYYQIPLVTTTIGAEGLSLEEEAFKVVDDADAMADMIAKLYVDMNELTRLSENCDTFIRKYFTPEGARKVLSMDMKL